VHVSFDASKDLDVWVKRLVAAWRSRRARSGRAGHRRGHDFDDEAPSDRLTRDELAGVGAAVKRLSHGLTRERELAGARYLDDPQLLGAYLLFYWPVSYAQARSTLSELGTRPRSVLDLGSGPGPLAFAALDAGANDVIAADRSKPALELARTLAAEAAESLGTREWSFERPLPDGTFDLVTMGHVLNELHGADAVKRAALLETAAAKLKPGGTLLVLEPALRDTSRALLEVRDVLVSKGYPVRAPCLFRGPCPALHKPSDWCHAERSWRMPALVEAIARAAGLHKESLKMSYLAVAAKGTPWAEPPPGRLFRIVSEPLEGKGRQRFMGCGPEGRLGLALQEKHRTELNQSFFKLNRGDVVAVTETEPRGDGVTLTERSQVQLVARAGAPVPAPKPQ
jgi:SAM-dependent methyltransferase